MASYGVNALFTSVPMDLSINIVKCKIQKDPLPCQRTNMSIPQIISLLEFFLKTHISSSKLSIMNRSMALSWVLPLVPLLPTCLFKTMKLRPSAWPSTALLMAKVCR